MRALIEVILASLWLVALAGLVSVVLRAWRLRNPPMEPGPAPDDLSPGAVHEVPGAWEPVPCFHADDYTEDDLKRMRGEVDKMINPPLIDVEPTEEEWRGVKS